MWTSLKASKAPKAWLWWHACTQPTKFQDKKKKPDSYTASSYLDYFGEYYRTNWWRWFRETYGHYCSANLSGWQRKKKLSQWNIFSSFCFLVMIVQFIYYTVINGGVVNSPILNIMYIRGAAKNYKTSIIKCLYPTFDRHVFPRRDM